jgi:group I intron endonuclease
MIIYKVTNKITGKSYIGQTVGYLSRRKYGHIYSSFKRQSKTYFHNSLRKYGEDNFIWKTIEKCDTKNQLDEMEYHYIKQYNTKCPNGYNLTDGYDNTTLGYKFTKEQNMIHSNKIKGKNNPNYGNGDKIRGDLNPAKRPEVRDKISKAKMGKKRPDVAGYRAKSYLITDIKTGIKTTIFNLAKWMRDNPGYHLTGIKRVMNGEYKQHKGLIFERKSF